MWSHTKNPSQPTASARAARSATRRGSASSSKGATKMPWRTAVTRGSLAARLAPQSDPDGARAPDAAHDRAYADEADAAGDPHSRLQEEGAVAGHPDPREAMPVPVHAGHDGHVQVAAQPPADDAAHHRQPLA